MEIKQDYFCVFSKDKIMQYQQKILNNQLKRNTQQYRLPLSAVYIFLQDYLYIIHIKASKISKKNRKVY